MAVERKRSTRRSVRHRGVPAAVRDQQVKRPRASKCKNCCRKFTAFLFSHVGLCALVVGYAIGGAFVFRALEAPHEVEKASQVSGMRNRTVQRLWNITYANNILFKENWTALVAVEIKQFQTQLMEAIKDGYEGKDSENQQWSFSGAFLFSLTVISTIGYGNISPRTEWGKIVTILYAIVGIPLMLLYLTNIGDILAKSFRYVYGRLCTCKSESVRDRRGRSAHQMKMHHPALQRSVSSMTPSAYQRTQLHSTHSLPNSPSTMYQSGSIGVGALPDHTAALGQSPAYQAASGASNLRIDAAEMVDPDFNFISERTKEPVRVHVPITLCLAILASYICGGGMLFSLWEGWDYLDGSYFCFVTLSTIGFGDLVPGSSVVGDSGSQEKLVICSLYLLAGLAVLAMCFNLMQDKVIHKVRNCGKRIGIIRDSEDFEEDFEDYDLS